MMKKLIVTIGMLVTLMAASGCGSGTASSTDSNNLTVVGVAS